MCNVFLETQLKQWMPWHPCQPKEVDTCCGGFTSWHDLMFEAGMHHFSLIMLMDRLFCPWFNRSHDGNSHHSDINWPDKTVSVTSRNQTHAFCEVVFWVSLCAACCLVCLVLTMCFADNLDDCEEKSGNLDLQRRHVMCGSMNGGSELSEMSGWFPLGSGQFDQNAPQFNFLWVSHLWHAQAITLVKCCSWKLYPKTHQLLTIALLLTSCWWHDKHVSMQARTVTNDWRLALFLCLQCYERVNLVGI